MRVRLLAVGVLSAGTVFASAPDLSTGTSVLAISRDPAQAVALGALPRLLREHPQLAGPFGTAMHAYRLGRRPLHAVAFEASNQLSYWSGGGAPDSIALSELRRRGVSLDIPVALPQEPLPRLAVQGHTLYALVQLDDPQREGKAAVIRFRIDQAACPWNYVKKQ